ncbi:hypothetical protein BC829DRAFT_406205 [Chytridium lagenaria]|nr:hypothetical protein BC829DRAFT_406205 [Chytridium lagenaria]
MTLLPPRIIETALLQTDNGAGTHWLARRMVDVVESVWRQSVRVDKVYVVVEDVEMVGRWGRRRVGEGVKELVETFPRKWLNVTVKERVKPRDKLLAALSVEKDPNTIIVLLDDDIVYHHNTVLSLSASLERLRSEGWYNHYTMFCLRTGRGRELCGMGIAKGGMAVTVGQFKGGKGLADFEIEGGGEGSGKCILRDDIHISAYLHAASYVRPFVIRNISLNFEMTFRDVTDLRDPFQTVRVMPRPPERVVEEVVEEDEEEWEIRGEDVVDWGPSRTADRERVMETMTSLLDEL